MSDLVRLTIEGQPVEVPTGTCILEAAKLAGVLVPHYCYHPSLPVAGVCRMCLVEVEKSPKLAASCATPVAEGMVVHVDSPQAKAFTNIAENVAAQISIQALKANKALPILNLKK
jgi:NADH dehydrogenase/NADH:ubiquinone oxidoreductase subunit G